MTSTASLIHPLPPPHHPNPPHPYAPHPPTDHSHHSPTPPYDLPHDPSSPLHSPPLPNDEMGTATVHLNDLLRYDLISIHISKDWSKYHPHSYLTSHMNHFLDNLQSTMVTSVPTSWQSTSNGINGSLIYSEFVNMMGLFYDEQSSNKEKQRGGGGRRRSTRNILNSILLQFEKTDIGNLKSEEESFGSETLRDDSSFTETSTIVKKDEEMSSNPSPYFNLGMKDKEIEEEVCLLSTTSPQTSTNSPQSSTTLPISTPLSPSLPQFESLLYDRIYLYSAEKAYLMLSPEKRKRLNLTTYELILPATSQCFGIPPVSWLVYNLLGYDTIMINLLSQLFEGKGHVYNIYSKQIFPLEIYNTHHLPPLQQHLLFSTSASSNNSLVTLYFQKMLSFVLYKVGILLSTVFLFFTMTTIVSYILNLTQSKMLKFTFLLQYHVQHNIPYGSVVLTHVVESLVFVPIMVGILFFLFEFFRDQLLSFLVLSLVWTCEVYSVLSVRTYLSMKYFPRIIFLYFCLLQIYLHSFPLGFSYIALYTNYCCDLHLMLYFFNYIEMPAYESGEISAVRPRYFYPIINTTTPTIAAIPSPPVAVGDENVIPRPMPNHSQSQPLELNDHEAQQVNPLDISNNNPAVDHSNNDPLNQIPPLTPGSINRPLDQILAAERAILQRQRLQQQNSPGMDQMSVSDLPLPPSRTISEESAHSQYESTYLLYGNPRLEELSGFPSAVTSSPADQIQLSREIQRQQLAAEMGFELPSLPSSIPRSSSSSQLTNINQEMPGESSGSLPSSVSSGSTGTPDLPYNRRISSSATRKGSISTFFTNIFTFNKNTPTNPSHLPPPSGMQPSSNELSLDGPVTAEIPQDLQSPQDLVGSTTHAPPPVTGLETGTAAIPQLPAAQPPKKFFQFPAVTSTTSPERRNGERNVDDLNASPAPTAPTALGYASLFRRKSISLFPGATSSPAPSALPAPAPPPASIPFRPRSHSEGLILSQSFSSQHTPFTSCSQPETEARVQSKIQEFGSLKAEVKWLCDLYKEKDRILQQRFHASIPTVPVPRPAIESPKVTKPFPRSSSSPAIVTRLSATELICQLTPEQIQLIRRRRKNLGNYSSDVVIAAVTRARAMSGTSSLGDDVPPGDLHSFPARDRSQSNVSIRSTQSTGYGSNNSDHSRTRGRGYSDCPVRRGKYLTPQQQQLQQRKYSSQDDDMETISSPLSHHQDSKESTVGSLTTSLYNILVQTISPRQLERHQFDAKISEEESGKQSHGSARDRNDSNSTTNTSSLSSHLTSSENHSLGFPPLSPRDFLSPENIVLEESEIEEQEIEEEDVKRIEECYQENTHEFSVFGVLDEDDGY